MYQLLGGCTLHTATDENGDAMLYRYTPLGQIEQAVDLATGTVPNAFAYDHLNRTQKEAVYGLDGVRSNRAYTYDC